MARLWVTSGPVTYFTKLQLLFLTSMIMGDVGFITYLRSHHCSVWLTQLWARSGPVTYLTDPALVWLARCITVVCGTAIGDVVAIEYFTEPALL